MTSLYRFRKFFVLFGFSFSMALSAKTQNTSSALYGLKWKEALHTAQHEAYLTEGEKEVIYYINLARMQPRYFADSVLKMHSGTNSLAQSSSEGAGYVASLYTYLKNMRPLPPLQPSKALYTTAQCFAAATGKSGATGHERKGTGCTAHSSAECCSYGKQKPLDIVLQLLVDNGVPSLGHRLICLGKYSQVGVSIQPHKTYRYTAVLDFK